MSLDYSLHSKEKREHKGTGVFVRSNGETKELQTIEEVKAYFPNMDVSNIEETVYYTEDFFSGNITHNLIEMAEHVPSSKSNLYRLLWRPEEEGYKKLSTEYAEQICECLSYLINNKEFLSTFNPSNGWGSYESLLKFMLRLAEALSKWDRKEEITIAASR